MKRIGTNRGDVLAVIADPKAVRSGGIDQYNRAKWLVRGKPAVGEDIEIVCAIEMEGPLAILITLYWRD